MNNNLIRWYLKFAAVTCFIIGVIGLTLCAKVYIKNIFVYTGGTINPIVFDGMIEMNKFGYFGIIPSMSGLLLISSLLMWICSRKFNNDNTN